MKKQVCLLLLSGVILLNACKNNNPDTAKAGITEKSFGVLKTKR